MVCRINWIRWALFFVIVLAFGLSDGARLGRSQVALSQTSPIDLSGDWELDSGGKVVITHLLATGSVFARFSPALPCHDTERVKLFDTRLKVTPVSGGPPKISLEDGAFEACTRDKKLIDYCTNIPTVKAVWTTKFRNATVSADGSTITGERFHEWINFEEKDGRYVNCRRNPAKDEWSKFTLTRVCAPDSAKLCGAIAKALRLIEKLIPPAATTSDGVPMPTANFDPTRWSQSLTQHKPALAAALDELRKQFCDDTASQTKIDEMKVLLEALGSSPAQTTAQVIAEQMKVAGVDVDLKAMSTAECSVGDAPPPEQPGICKGLPRKSEDDDREIDKLLDHLKKSLEKAVKLVEKYERETGKRDDYGRVRVDKWRKLLRHWEQIRRLSCVPREIIGLLKAMEGGSRSDMCTRLCERTADWLYSDTPGRTPFFISCSILCED